MGVPKRPTSTATHLVINENVYQGKQRVSLNSRRTPLRKVHSQPTILVTYSTIWWLIKSVLDANFWLLFSTCPNSFRSFAQHDYYGYEPISVTKFIWNIGLAKSCSQFDIHRQGGLRGASIWKMTGKGTGPTSNSWAIVSSDLEDTTIPSMGGVLGVIH